MSFADHTASAGFRVPAQADHTASLGFVRHADHAAPLPIRAHGAADHTAPLPVYRHRVADHTSGCGFVVRHLGTADHMAPLPIYRHRVADHAAGCGFVVRHPGTAEHTASLGFDRHSDHATPLPIHVHGAVDHTAPTPIHRRRRTDHAAPLPLFVRRTADHAAPLPVPAEFWYRADHTASLRILPAIPPRDDTLAAFVTLVATDHALDTGTVEVSQGDSDLYWTASVELRNPDDYFRLRNQDLIDIQIGDGPTWRLMIETRDYDQPSRGLATASLRAISPSANDDSPRAHTQAWLWDEPRMAADIAAEIVPALDVQWNRVNWLVLPYRLALDDATPLAALSHLVTESGGRLHTQPDGQTLRIEDRHKAGVPALSTATPDIELTDLDDLFVASETDTYSVGANRIRVYDQAPAQSDQVETELDGLEAQIRVYPQPWRTNLRLRTTRGDLVTTAALGPETRVVEGEEIEIAEGAGAARYPIQTLISAQYLSDSLGAIVTTAYSREIATAEHGYSLLRISYSTRALLYGASASETGTAQFVVDEIP